LRHNLIYVTGGMFQMAGGR